MNKMLRLMCLTVAMLSVMGLASRAQDASKIFNDGGKDNCTWVPGSEPDDVAQHFNVSPEQARDIIAYAKEVCKPRAQDADGASTDVSRSIQNAEEKASQTFGKFSKREPVTNALLNRAFDGNEGQSSKPFPLENWGFGLTGGGASAQGKTAPMVSIFLERRLPILPKKVGGIYAAVNLPCVRFENSDEIRESGEILSRVSAIDYTDREVWKETTGTKLAPFFDLSYTTPAVLKRVRGEFGLGLTHYATAYSVTKEVVVRHAAYEQSCYIQNCYPVSGGGTYCEPLPAECSVNSGIIPGWRPPDYVWVWNSQVLSEKFLSRTEETWKGWLGNWHAGLRLALRAIEKYNDETMRLGLDLIF